PVDHLDRVERDRAADGARGGRGTKAGERPAQRIADRQIGVGAVLDFEIRPVERCTEVRKPEVVVSRVDAPDGRQLDVPGGIAEHAIGEEAVAEVLAVERHGAERTGLSEGHVAGGALGVVGLELEVVAAIGVQAQASLTRPPPTRALISMAGVETEIALREWAMPVVKGRQRGIRWRMICPMCASVRDALHFVDGVWCCRGSGSASAGSAACGNLSY